MIEAGAVGIYEIAIAKTVQIKQGKIPGVKTSSNLGVIVATDKKCLWRANEPLMQCL